MDTACSDFTQHGIVVTALYISEAHIKWSRTACLPEK